MPEHQVEAIANEFFKRSQAEGFSLTNMQLQKLPYIAHGWSLALIGEALITDVPLAFPYGPVYPKLYDALKKYGSGKVEDYIRVYSSAKNRNERGNLPFQASLSEDETKLIDAVWEKYKGFHAYKLSQLTHQPDSPWTITTNTNAPFSPIENSIIKKHYLDLAKRN